MRHRIAVSTLALLVFVGMVIVLGEGCRREEGTPSGSTAPATATPKVVNVICPIMGTKIDPTNVPNSLIREYKGQRVGFCCSLCPPEWDKLTDAEKDAKLKASLPKPPQTGPRA